MTSPIAIVAYLLAFLILIVYTADAFVQWRYLRGKSKKYLAIQLVVIISVGAADVTLVVLHERGAKEAVLHGLQGLSFLQSLVITAMLAVRVRIGKEHLLDWKARFPWVSSVWAHFAWAFCLVSLVVLSFFCTAIGFILSGDEHKRYLVFVAFATIAAHCFPACFVAIRLDIAKVNGNQASPFSSWVIPLNLLTLPASVLPQLSPDITGFLLGHNIVCFYSNCLWVALMIYIFRRNTRTRSGEFSTGNDQGMSETQTSVVTASVTSEGESDSSTLVSEGSVSSGSTVANSAA